MPDKSKFEREIDEILEKSEDEAEPTTSRTRRSGQHRSFEPFSPNVPKSKPNRRLTNIKFNPGTLIIAGIVILALAALTPIATLPIAIVGLALAIIGYALWFRVGQRSSTGSPIGGGFFGRKRSSEQPQNDDPQVKYWRGRRIEEKPQSKKSEQRGKIIDFGSPDDDK